MSLNSLLFCECNRQGSSKCSSTMPSLRNLISHWCHLVILRSCALLECFYIKEATPNYKLYEPTKIIVYFSFSIFQLCCLRSLQLSCGNKNVTRYQYSHKEDFTRNTPKSLVKISHAIILTKFQNDASQSVLCSLLFRNDTHHLYDLCCRDVSHRSLKCYPPKVSELWR